MSLLSAAVSVDVNLTGQIQTIYTNNTATNKVCASLSVSNLLTTDIELFLAKKNGSNYTSLVNYAAISGENYFPKTRQPFLYLHTLILAPQESLVGRVIFDYISVTDVGVEINFNDLGSLIDISLIGIDETAEVAALSMSVF